METSSNRLTHLFLFHANWFLLLCIHVFTLFTCVPALIWYNMSCIYLLGSGCLCQFWPTAPEIKRGEQEGEREREREHVAFCCSVWAAVPAPVRSPVPADVTNGQPEHHTPRCRANKLTDSAPSVLLKAFRLIFSRSAFLKSCKCGETIPVITSFTGFVR